MMRFYAKVKDQEKFFPFFLLLLPEEEEYDSE